MGSAVTKVLISTSRLIYTLALPIGILSAGTASWPLCQGGLNPPSELA